MMQHIINVAFDFDDETVKRNIENNVEDEVIKRIQEEIEREVFFTGYYYNSGRSNLQEYCHETVKEILSRREDEIVEKAIRLFAEKLARKKVVRDRLGELYENN